MKVGKPLSDYTDKPFQLVGRKDPVLHQPAAPVDTFDRSVARVFDLMEQRMSTSGGCGLAAPQVGIPYRMMVINAGRGRERVVNPEIVGRSGGRPSLEGCLSLAGTLSLVWRSSHVTVAGQDQTGRPVTRECSGFDALVYQHEIDHLDGKMMTDRTLVNVTALRALGGVAGGFAGALVRGAAGAAVGGVAGVAAGWAIEQLL